MMWIGSCEPNSSWISHTRSISDHARTNMALIGEFLPVEFRVDDVAPGVRAVRVA